jgi:cyclic pyranopterin phosphate synthase
MTALDRLRRPLRSLRLSVTDRCNLRCGYCMPEEDYLWLPRTEILGFEELAVLAGAFASLGVTELRLTGGEPLLRRDLPVLVGLLCAVPGIAEVTLTTNGVLLARHASALRQAGLARLTVSLDTLDPERFARLTKRHEHSAVLAGIEAARAAGFQGTKLNTVVMRGVNEDEIVPLLEFARERGLEPRFIEYMDVGGATRWSRVEVVTREEIVDALARRFGRIAALPSADLSAPAQRFRLPDGTVFGVIASTTAPFCRTCDRARLTADGRFYTCLYAPLGTDLRLPLRRGAARGELAARILGLWREREDRGAEVRLALAERSPLRAEALRADPHLEMHTRGG